MTDEVLPPSPHHGYSAALARDSDGWGYRVICRCGWVSHVVDADVDLDELHAAHRRAVAA